MCIDMKAVRIVSRAFGGGLWIGTTGYEGGEYKLTAEQIAKLEKRARKLGEKLGRSIKQQ